MCIVEAVLLCTHSITKLPFFVIVNKVDNLAELLCSLQTGIIVIVLLSVFK